jgi:Zn-dependent peptidase ImmA (M78 family)/transcriptional regulator with XRE-family HTH domain
MARVEIKPELVRWARERATLSAGKLARRFPRLPEWESGTAKPTLRQLEEFANATTTPLGYLFLPEPPEEVLPIPDFRTLGDRPVHRPSPNLLDTVFDMQRRQAWLREERIEEGLSPLSFVGSATPDAVPEKIAATIRRTLGVSAGWADLYSSWSEALRALRDRIEAVGIIVVINGVVGNNNHRKLDPEEFRGFVLVDVYAPLVFVNAADGKAAQMFTLAHELAHIWVGRAALFDLREMQPAPDPTERFCNAAAAEFLIPEAELRAVWAGAYVGSGQSLERPFQYLARRFKVSELVAARRALDLGLITREAFSSFYNEYIGDERRRSSAQSGGNFYATQNSRIGRSFAEAVARAVREGRLLYRDAFDLTGLRGATFDRYIESLEAAAER